MFVVLALLGTTRAVAECVILFHGLGRTPLSMLPLEFAVERAGFSAVNHGYPSLASTIDELAATHVPEALAECGVTPDVPVHFVTHSMGGILVRYYLQNHDLPAGSRMVMLGPPNHGSELIDEFAEQSWFSVMGPAALQLGTGPESVPLGLAPVDRGELGAAESVVSPTCHPVAAAAISAAIPV